jgi:hypothetical protein
MARPAALFENGVGVEHVPWLRRVPITSALSGSARNRRRSRLDRRHRFIPNARSESMLAALSSKKKPLQAGFTPVYKMRCVVDHTDRRFHGAAFQFIRVPDATVRVSTGRACGPAAGLARDGLTRASCSFLCNLAMSASRWPTTLIVGRR